MRGRACTRGDPVKLLLNASRVDAKQLTEKDAVRAESRALKSR